MGRRKKRWVDQGLHGPYEMHIHPLMTSGKGGYMYVQIMILSGGEGWWVKRKR